MGNTRGQLAYRCQLSGAAHFLVVEFGDSLGRLTQLPGHLVERPAEISDLVVPVDLDLHAEVAGVNALCRANQPVQRCDDRAGNEPNDREEQQHKCRLEGDSKQAHAPQQPERTRY